MFNSKGGGHSQQHWCPRDVLSPGNRGCLARSMHLFLRPNDLNLPVGMGTKIQLDCEKGKSVKLIFAATFVSLIPLMIKLLGQSISCLFLSEVNFPLFSEYPAVGGCLRAQDLRHSRVRSCPFSVKMLMVLFATRLLDFPEESQQVLGGVGSVICSMYGCFPPSISKTLNRLSVWRDLLCLEMCGDHTHLSKNIQHSNQLICNYNSMWGCNWVPLWACELCKPGTEQRYLGEVQHSPSKAICSP